MNDLTIDDLPIYEADRVRSMVAACKWVAGQPDRMAAFKEAAADVTAQMAVAAAAHGRKPRPVSAKTMEASFYRWMKAGQNWAALVDGRKLEVLRRGVLTRQPRFLAFLAQLAAKHKRSLHSAVKELHRLWRAGEVIPGYEGMNYKRNLPLPHGWSYDNLMDRMPDERALLMTRQGMRAAAALLPQVRSTRAGSWPCAFVMFDDVWLDCLAWGPAPNGKFQLGRPLQLGALDFYTGKRLCYGTKLRTMDESGKHLQLTEDEMLFTLCDFLYNVGYSPRGTVLVVEHGTAAINEVVEQRLLNITEGRVQVQRSGIIGKDQVGAFEGRGVGNFHHKAHLESWHNLLHNEMDGEKLHVGHARTEPETLEGLRRLQENLLKGMDALPGFLQAQLCHYAPSLYELCEHLPQVVGRIDNRTEHDLEGWQECGFMMQEVTLDGLNWTAVDALPDGMRELMTAAALAKPELFRARRMSPQEAWLRETAKPENKLVRLTAAECVALMGVERAFPVKMRGGHFDISSAKRHFANLTFSTEVVTAAGLLRELPFSDDYQGVFNPISGNLFILDARGRCLGEAPLVAKAPRGDAAEMERALGEARARQAAIKDRVAAPLAPQTAADEAQIAWNNAVLAVGKNPQLATPAPKLGNRRAAPALTLAEDEAEAPQKPRRAPALTLAEDDELPEHYTPSTFNH